MAILSTVKILLKIVDDTQDELLQLYINMIIQKILNYCNISELPIDLEFTIAEMVVELYRDEQNKNKVGEVIGAISSISEGGRSVGFSTNTQNLQTNIQDKITKKDELKKFRKLYKV